MIANSVIPRRSGFTLSLSFPLPTREGGASVLQLCLKGTQLLLCGSLYFVRHSFFTWFHVYFCAAVACLAQGSSCREALERCLQPLVVLGPAGRGSYVMPVFRWFFPPPWVGFLDLGPSVHLFPQGKRLPVCLLEIQRLLGGKFYLDIQF